MTDAFRIELLDQGWLGGLEPDDDPCSHGHLRLTIGGIEAVGGSERYGISESALALLRTLAAEHTPQAPVADRMIFHGCGTFLMMGCPIGADFSVRHRASLVNVGNVVRYDTTNEDQAVRFTNLDVTMPALEYRIEVLAFAVRARELFAGSTKRFADDFYAQQYHDFWIEFDQLLTSQGQAA